MSATVASPTQALPPSTPASSSTTAAAITSSPTTATASPTSITSPGKPPGTASGLKSPKGKAGLGKSQIIAAPVEEEKPIVFKGSTRAKKVFKIFDHDKDKFLNRHEFEVGLQGFINGPGLPPLTPEQIEALWLETDLNKDEKISWAEFNYRFCGGPNPNTLGKKVEKKMSLHLQTPRKRELLTGKGATVLNELKSVLEAMYNGPKPRYKEVDLSKVKSLNQAALKKLLTSIVAEEKAEAKKNKRQPEEWALPFLNGSIEQKNVDKLWIHLNVRKADTLDLSAFIEQLKLRPSKGGKSTKKKKKDTKHLSGPQAYVLTTVKPEHVRDFISENLLKHMPDNINHSVKCHPPLKHWGDDEKKKKGLNTEGYKTTIFLSERTKIKAVVKLAPEAPLSPSIQEQKTPQSTGRLGPNGEPVNHSDILIFAAYRTEYTAMARFEYLWHARITMDEDENIKKVELKQKKNWVDGELDQCSNEACFDDWISYVGQDLDEFDEMSIPPIG